MKTSRIPSVLIFAALLGTILPGGNWMTLGGGIHWLWGFPFATIQVHGRSPYDGEVSFIASGILWDFLIWLTLIFTVYAASCQLEIWTKGRIRSPLCFTIYCVIFIVLYLVPMHAYLMHYI